MPVTIPFLVSETNYRLHCPVDDYTLIFDVRWNSRDEAWYFDLYEDDDLPILLNIKVILGIPLGRRSRHPFFESNIMTAVDTTGQGIDPGFDDLNSRVVVVIQNATDLAF